MSHLKIRQIYEARLSAWAAARFTTKPEPLRVEVQNTVFVPTDGEIYLKAYMMPTGPYSDAVGGDHKIYTGVFQVSVVTPAGKGPGRAEGIVDELSALFPLFDRYSKADITVVTMTPVEQGPGIPDGNNYTVAASFRYRADTN